MKYIGIDPSLTSTAIVYHHNKSWKYWSFHDKKTVANKWKELLPFVHFHDHVFTAGSDYNEQEILKIQEYYFLVGKIVREIDFLGDEKVMIESYSQNSKNGRIIDLVQFSTLLRLRLLSEAQSLKIIAPKSLKSEVAKMFYEPDKKGVYRNKEGVAGGSFQKWEMLESLMLSTQTSPLLEWLKDNYKDIKDLKSIPKPIDDLIDAELLCRLQMNVNK